MARYEHLPIYMAALDLVVHLERVVYTLGTELRQTSRAVLQQVVRANGLAHRSERVAAFSSRLIKESTAWIRLVVDTAPQY